MKNKKHSPLKNRPLRNPGQSLDEKIQDILYDDVYSRVAISSLFIIVAVMEWSRQIFNTSPAPIFWSFIALVAIGYYTIKIAEALRKIKNIKLGRDGEKIVGQGLEKLRSAGYKVFHDIVDSERGFNVDHIIIGPAGVFTIETKTISKSDGVRKIKCDGDNIKIDGFSPDRNPIFQAKAQAHWLHDFILVFTGMKIAVKPVVIYPGWFIESEQRNADVWVLNEKALSSFLQNQKTVLDEEKISSIATQIAKYNQMTI